MGVKCYEAEPPHRGDVAKLAYQQTKPQASRNCSVTSLRAVFRRGNRTSTRLLTTSGHCCGMTYHPLQVGQHRFHGQLVHVHMHVHIRPLRVMCDCADKCQHIRDAFIDGNANVQLTRSFLQLITLALPHALAFLYARTNGCIHTITLSLHIPTLHLVLRLRAQRIVYINDHLRKVPEACPEFHRAEARYDHPPHRGEV